MNGSREQPTGAPVNAPDARNGLLRASKVRELLDCSDRTLRRWVAAGKFPPPDRKIGRTLRWRASTVNEFIEGGDQ